VANKSLRQAIQSHVIRLLREERIRQRVSITSLATLAGLSQPMVSYVERELRKPTLDTLLRLTEALGIDLANVIRKATDAASRQKSGLNGQ